MKLSKASHSVIGGNKQIAINQDQWPGEPAEKFPAKMAAPSIAIGPKMYTPARNHPHGGVFFQTRELIKPMDTRLITEVRFNIKMPRSELQIEESSTKGVQNANPPSAIAYKLRFIGVERPARSPGLPRS